MSASRFHCGCNLRQALSYARNHGYTLTNVRRTGELRITHERLPYSVKVKRSRKDAPRHLTNFLRRLGRGRGRRGPKP